MKKFKQLTEELFNECGDYGADNMTIKELKIARNAAENILEMIEDGVSVQRWQISAIVKASEELASVCASMRADEEDYDNGWEDEEEPIYVGFEYPSMYGEEVEKTHHAARVGKITWGVGKTPEEAIKDAHHSIHQYYAASAPSKNDKHIDAHMAKADNAKKALKVHPIHKRVYNRYVSEEHSVGGLPDMYVSGNSPAEVVKVNEELNQIDKKELAAVIKSAKEKNRIVSVEAVKYIKSKLNLPLTPAMNIWNNMRRDFNEEVEQIDEVEGSAKRNRELFKKQFKEDTELSEAPLLGPQGAIHRAASADQSDREYAAQRSFKNAWKAKNPGKQWPGYEKAGFKSPYDFKEETDFEVDVEGLPKMYVKANNPSEVKTNLRKVVKNPEMIRGIERVAKASLQKIFRDKAMGKDEVSEEVEQIDEAKKLTDTKADWRYDKSPSVRHWSHDKLMKVAKHDRSVEKEIKRRIASKEYVFSEELDFKVSVDGLPDMYVKANSPAEVKTNLRKVIKKPDSSTKSRHIP